VTLRGISRLRRSAQRGSWRHGSVARRHLTARRFRRNRPAFRV